MIPFIPWETFPSEPAAAILPWAPDWVDGVQESLSWKMGSALSKSGIEQRRSVRRDPRLGLEFSTLVEPADVPLLQSLLLGWGAQTWAVPLWYGQVSLSAAALAGDDMLVVGAGSDTLFQVGGWALVWADSRVMEYAQVLDFDDTGIILDTPLVGSFPIGTKVAPLQFMTLQDSQSFSPLTSAITKVGWIFKQAPGHTQVLEVADPAAWTETFPTGASAAEPRNHFFAFAHNWGGSPEVTVTTLADVHDPDVGVLSRRLSVDRTSPVWAIDTLLDTRASTAALRRFLSAHRGPTVSFWAPSPMRDLGLAGDITGAVLPVFNNAQHLVPPQLRMGVELTYPGGQARGLVAAVAPTTVTLVDDPLVNQQLFTESFAGGLADYSVITGSGSGFSVASGVLTIGTTTSINLLRRSTPSVSLSEFTFEFRIGTPAPDDAGAIGVLGADGAVGLLSFNPMRETAQDSSRRPWAYYSHNGVALSVVQFGSGALDTGVWHSFELYLAAGRARGKITNLTSLAEIDLDLGLAPVVAATNIQFSTDATSFSASTPSSFRNVVLASAAEVLPDVALENVNRARWVSRARLAVETVTIRHMTDQVATVRLPVVAVDDGGTAPSVTSPA